MLQLLISWRNALPTLLCGILALWLVFGTNGQKPRAAYAAGQDGAVDLTFNPGTGANGNVWTVATQPDGKVLIGGLFTSYNGTPRNYLARLNSDGSLDTTFLNTGIGANSNVRAIAVQPDGKILIGGDFNSYNGTPRARLARLNTDGSLDPNFDSGVVGSNVFAVVVQPNGKILIGGTFGLYSGEVRSRIARINPDGSLDTTFDHSTGANSQVRAIAMQPDGKILIGGQFTFYDDITRNHIARLKTDGSLDTSFLNPDIIGTTGTGANAFVRTIELQPDGKILIGGDFTTYNGTPRNHLARINPDGTLDTTFNPGTGADSVVGAVVVQPDTRILIAGGFTNYNGTPRNRLARINSDGSLDPNFNPNSGANGEVRTLMMQPEGKVLIGGDFSSVDVYTLTKIARLENRVRPASSIILASTPNPSILGESVTFTATIAPITATGTIQFNIGGSTLVTSSLANGVATYTTNLLALGTIQVVATYRGDTNFAPSTSSTYTHIVNRIATSVNVSSSLNPSVVGQNVTFTATVSPALATGTLTFTIGVTNVIANLNNGVATYITNALPVGTYSVTVAYGGNAIYSPSVSSGQYTHTVTDCNPLVVVNSTDNGTASTCGTFSHAVLNATSGVTITFAVTNITFSSVPTLTLQAGVVLDGGVNGVTLDGGTLSGDGLVLGGNNRLINLTIRDFNGRGLVVPSSKTGNKLDRVKVTKT
jgi:uncharacterized delta-60 repeat protein